MKHVDHEEPNVSKKEQALMGIDNYKRKGVYIGEIPDFEHELKLNETPKTLNKPLVFILKEMKLLIKK